MTRFAPALCLLFPVFCTLLLPSAVRADGECRYWAERAAEEPMDGIRTVVVKAGAGHLEIHGEPGRQRMQARGKACASDEHQLERTQIRVQRSGDTLVISSIPSNTLLHPKNWFGGGHSQLDLSIVVPPGIALDVEDGSGDAHISNVGSLKIIDGSGALRIEEINGALELEDGSGDVAIARARGPVRIKDGLGDVEIQQIAGDVTIVNDGSGGLAILDVRGDVTIGNDGSGEIRIERVSGNVRIKNDGSGDIHVSHVKRNVTVDRDGSGDIVVQDIEGDLAVGEAGGGRVHHVRVGGRISLADSKR